MSDMLCPACDEVHDGMTWNLVGTVCARCNNHTGNNNQGHYWGLCRVLLDKGVPYPKAVRKLHFCCPVARAYLGTADA